MSDDDVEAEIERLEQERERLRAREGEDDPTLAADVRRLAAIEVELGRQWDLLRQRRALRAAGEDETGARERAGETVAGYDTVTPYDGPEI